MFRKCNVVYLSKIIMRGRVLRDVFLYGNSLYGLGQTKGRNHSSQY